MYLQCGCARQTHGHNELNAHRDDYTNIADINKDAATQSVNAVTPYDVRFNIPRRVIGPFLFT